MPFLLYLTCVHQGWEGVAFSLAEDQSDPLKGLMEELIDSTGETLTGKGWHLVALENDGGLEMMRLE
jgi:hypothetical protein